MRNFYAFLLLLLIGNFGFGQTTIAQQDFDGSNPIWAYTESPSSYGTGSDDWEILTTNADPSGTSGSFWGIQDLDNPNGGGAFDHTLTFSAISISAYQNVTIDFDFYTVGFDSADYLEYEIFYGPSGVEVGQGQVTLNKNTNAWTNISVSIPDSADSAYIVIIANQDGGSDYAGLDNFKIEGTLVSSYDTDSEADDSGSQPLGATISSLSDTPAEAIEVFQLDLYDFGSGDAVDTEVTKIRLYPHTTNTADWTDNILGVTVSDGSVINPSSVTIDNTFIDIFFTSGDLTILDGDITPLSIAVYLNTSNLTDGGVLSFMVDADNHGFEADAAGSTFASTFSGGDFTSSDFTIGVVATELSYLTQPTNVTINTIMSPSVEIATIDANGNIDIDFTGSGFDIDLTTDGSFNGSATISVETINGIALFNNLIFDNIASGIKLTAFNPSTIISGSFDSDSFDVIAIPVGTADLIFSEYIEGSSNNKYLEIYNGTGSTVDLADYSVELYSNGSSSANNTEDFTGGFPATLLDGEVIVLKNSSATIYSSTAYSSTVCNFNGDDALVLRKNGVIIDIIGNIGCDPGSQWDDGGNTTQNETLIRNSSVCEGIILDPTNSPCNFPTIDSEWTSFSIDDVSNLGAHTANCGPTTYTYDGITWSPTDPNGASLSTEAIIIESGTTSISASTDINTVTVNPGAGLTIDSGATLTVANGITLESNATSYSSLILDGTIAGTVIYKRHVNTFNNTTGSTNGQNDLISAPVTNASQDFGTFRGVNTNIPSGTVGGTTTFYLFGPYNNSSASNPYTLFSDADDATVITAGTGYRTASTDTSTFTFTGDVLSNALPVTITTGTNNAWNLIGNPYPSYINSTDFLTLNGSNLDQAYIGIYGYDGDASNGWNVINLNTSVDLTPGQGFMVLTDQASTAVNFTPAMRRTSTGDDFIVGRTEETNAYFSLKIENATSAYSTDFYFNNNSTRALDPGYDSAMFNSQIPDFYVYSHLIENNNGIKMAIQSLGETDLTDVTIPLGVNSNQLEQITFSINESTLPSAVEVYLEDNVENTFTLLTSGDYTITPNTNLDGTGRFYLRFTTTALSEEESTLSNLSIFNNISDKTIVISGQLLESTIANLYDIQGRLVKSSLLQSTNRSQTIDVSNLSIGVYVIELINGTQTKTQKVILR